MAEVYMYYPDEREHYINFIRGFQGRLDLTNRKMAELLDLPDRTFSRFMSGVSIGHELDLNIRVYELSGQMMYRMVGAKVPREVEYCQLYSQLDPEYQRIADGMLHLLWEEQRRKKEH